ncbi:MAG TPA: hypothetical protein VKU41_32885 [Polyangiaceae bacterium]|nr:hypothetical protein [Polyangiaceae bacterium]
MHRPNSRFARACGLTICAAIGGAACSLIVGGEDRRVASEDASVRDAGSDVGAAPSEEPSADGTQTVGPDVADVLLVESAAEASAVAGDAGPEAGADATMTGADANDADVVMADAAPEAAAPSDALADVAADGGTTSPAAGSLDPLFGDGGIAITSFGGDAVVNALAIDRQGNVVAAGNSSANGMGARVQATVARYTPDGLLDTTFGGNGLASTAIGTSSSSANAVAVGPGGILIAGPASSNSIDSGRVHIGLARFTNAGASDSTFGTAGSTIAVNAPGYPETPYALTQLADGRCVVAAAAQDSAGQYAEVARFTPAGAIDTTCNGPYGFQLQYDAPAAETPYGMVATDVEAGTVVHVGSAANKGAGGAAYAMRSGSDCTLDPTFDGVFDFSSGPDSARAVALSGSAYVLAGVANAGPSSDVFLARLTASGSLDPSFAPDGGFVTTDVDGGQDDGRAVAVDGRGRIVVAGANASPGGAASQIVVVRYTPSGSLDAAFGTGGVVVVQLGSPSAANALALQADGKIVVGGYATASKHKVFALVRLNP